MEESQAQSPVAGLGVDIVEIERMEQTLARTPNFALRVFTEDERAYCDRMHKPAVHYATHFAAKEAVLKALGTGFSAGIAPTDVEVTHNDKGRPIPVLHGRAKEVADEQGVLEMHLSLSRTHGTAVANAIAITQAARPVKEERVDPKSELAAAFKELRGMLDELDAQGEEPVDDNVTGDGTEKASSDE